jgi:hypothetical protein
VRDQREHHAPRPLEENFLRNALSAVSTPLPRPGGGGREFGAASYCIVRYGSSAPNSHGATGQRKTRGGEGHTKWLETGSPTAPRTPRAGLRTQRAFFNVALALLGMLKVFSMCPTEAWVDRARLTMTLTHARQARLPSP